MFLIALSPILWLIIALSVLKIAAYKACPIALVIALTAGIFVNDMTIPHAVQATLEGVALACWPILLVIIAAIFTYNLTLQTKAMDTIKKMLTSVSNDRRVLILLIGWGFGGFLEGMAGFGTAVAIPASMLAALGVNPITAILACLLANGLPTMFGSIGIPTATLATITGIDPIQLAFTQALQAFPFVLVTPLLMVGILGGKKAMKGIVPVALIAAVSFGIPEIIAARFIGTDLPDVVGAVCALVITFAFCLRHKDAEVPDEFRLEIAGAGEPISAGDALTAWCPFILIFVVLLLTSKLVPFIHDPLSAIKSTVNIYAGNPKATLTFSWINTPGVLIFICGIVGGIIQKCPFGEMMGVLKDTVKQMSKTIFTMLGVLGCAKIMGYSGMIASIAAFFVGTLGSFYPLVAPLLGALGTFVTGSGTSSEVLFGNVQLQAANTLGANETWLVAANSLGTSAGKMIAPQSIAIGCASCGLIGKDGEILGKIAKYAFAYAAVMAVLIYLGVLLGL